MNVERFISDRLAEAIKEIYGQPAPEGVLQLQATRKEFEGDLTAMMFPLLKISRQSPEKTGETVGAWLKEHCAEVASVNVVKGFLNIKLSAEFWHAQLQQIAATKDYGIWPGSGKT
ncbi:MAG: arginine--tRNA ligase, partial [Prevotellaceae bacterium]|nr:arginine--tRNA ligase [Prevotellaceae bacterium]